MIHPPGSGRPPLVCGIYGAQVLWGLGLMGLIGLMRRIGPMVLIGPIGPISPMLLLSAAHATRTPGSPAGRPASAWPEDCGGWGGCSSCWCCRRERHNGTRCCWTGTGKTPPRRALLRMYAGSALSRKYFEWVSALAPHLLPAGRPTCVVFQQFAPQAPEHESSPATEPDSCLTARGLGRSARCAVSAGTKAFMGCPLSLSFNHSPLSAFRQAVLMLATVRAFARFSFKVAA